MRRVVMILVALGVMLLILAVGISLAEFPGNFTFTWFDYRVSGTALSLIIIMLGIALLGWLPLAIWHRARLWGVRHYAHRQSRRQQRIEDAVLGGFRALSSTDAKDAQRQLKQLKREKAGIWVDFLGAQIASQKGQWDVARRHFHALLNDARTSLIARRFLADQALARDDDRRAWEHIDAAARINPNAVWITRSKLQLHIRQGNWNKALEVMDTKSSSRLTKVDKSDKRLRAVLLFERARHAEGQGYIDQARADVRRALETDPVFIPAVVRFARALIQDGYKDKAITFLAKSWKRSPHPDLVSLNQEINADAMERYAITQKICRYDAKGVEARIVQADAALDAGLIPRAKKLLEPVGEMTTPPAEACLLFARLCDDDSREEENWRRRALENPRSANWTCTSCRVQASIWSSTCQQCGSFASMDWRRIGDSESAKKSPAPSLSTSPSIISSGIPSSGISSDSISSDISSSGIIGHHNIPGSGKGKGSG